MPILILNERFTIPPGLWVFQECCSRGPCPSSGVTPGSPAGRWAEGPEPDSLSPSPPSVPAQSAGSHSAPVRTTQRAAATDLFPPLLQSAGLRSHLLTQGWRSSLPDWPASSADAVLDLCIKNKNQIHASWVFQKYFKNVNCHVAFLREVKISTCLCNVSVGLQVSHWFWGNLSPHREQRQIPPTWAESAAVGDGVQQ